MSEQWHRIPQELRERPQWLLAGPNEFGHLKVPTSIKANGSLCAGSSTNQATWLSFQHAAQVATERGLGIGYVLSADDPFTCIDLDVKDVENAPDKPESWTTPEQRSRFDAILHAFESYTERSRSGKGWHVWLHGKVGRGHNRDGVEVYSQERFIVCTGDVTRDVPIRPGGNKLSNLYSQAREKRQEVVEQEEPGVVEEDAGWVAQQAFDDPGEMGSLFRGDWQGRYTSQSHADLALVKMLARLTASNRVCWEAFRLSMLGRRDKAARPDYAKSTLAKARTHLANDAVAAAHGKQIVEGLFWPSDALAIASTESPASQEGAPSPFFRLLGDADLFAMPRGEWMVKGIVPAQGVGTIYGPSGSGKSFLTLDLLAHVAHGQPWFGRRTHARTAVYVPFEGKGGIPDRIRAWRMSHQPAQSSGIAFIYEGLNLRQPSDRAKLLYTLKTTGYVGGVLCLDTLAQAFPGIDENTSEGMGSVIAVAHELQAHLGGVVLLLHHTGKDEARGMRGWSGLLAALDFAIECQPSQEKGSTKYDRQFVLAKVKDGEAGGTLQFTMQPQTVAYDAHNEPITSLSVKPTLKEAQPPLAPGAMALLHAEQDNFVWKWISEQVTDGKKPTGRSLEGQRSARAPHMSQKHLRDALARLEAAGRLLNDGSGPKSQLRAIESTPSNT